ncbi:MAG: hypothetical protein QOE28_3065, partial [Solirubrobacteraceae bacterium]|nr:hypothetical protein [Solirubrobacteraceae bacterium]
MADDVVQGRGPAGAGGWLAQACKLIVAIRSGILLVTILELSSGRTEQRTLAIIALVAAGVA